MLTLYYSPGACSMASHIVLRQSGRPFEAKQVLIADGEHRSETYLRINPRGRVPALVTPDGILTETIAILDYLARSFPDLALLPIAPFARAGCLSTMAWFASTVHPTFRTLTRTERLASDPAIRAQIKTEARVPIWALLTEIDSMLAISKWMAGNTYSACDPYALVFYTAGVSTAFPMESLPHFTSFAERMFAIPAVREVLEVEGSPLLDRLGNASAL